MDLCLETIVLLGECPLACHANAAPCSCHGLYFASVALVVLDIHRAIKVSTRPAEETTGMARHCTGKVSLSIDDMPVYNCAIPAQEVFAMMDSQML